MDVRIASIWFLSFIGITTAHSQDNFIQLKFERKGKRSLTHLLNW